MISKFIEILMLNMVGVLVMVGPGFGEPLVYPTKGQRAEQQDRDEYAYHQWAVDQKGIDPSDPANMQKYSSQAPEEGGEVVGGAAKGAALGAIGGAIGGGAGKGAAIGAAVGGGSGLFRHRRHREERHAAERQAHQRYEQDMQTYDRAWGLCMKGRGYEVGSLS